jgi:hypothetical protein
MMTPTMCTDSEERLPENVARELVLCEVLVTRILNLMEVIRLAEDCPAGRDYLIAHTANLAGKLWGRFHGALAPYDSQLADVDLTEAEVKTEIEDEDGGMP